MQNTVSHGMLKGTPASRMGQKDVRSISDVDWAGKLISEGSGAVG